MKEERFSIIETELNIRILGSKVATVVSTLPTSFQNMPIFIVLYYLEKMDL
jgi:hypothetical protein